MNGPEAVSIRRPEVGKTRRILSLDGGGIKGVLPVAFLAEIEEITGKRFLDYFDLIAGTSTGGIIALGLGLGLSAQQILEFYCNYGPAIFGQRDPWTRRLWRSMRHPFRSKYSPKVLKHSLAEVFGKKRLGDCSTRLVIPSFNPALRSVHVFKTAHHERFAQDWTTSAVDVALSTGAAPTYFPRHTLPSGVGLLDGGVWANNPVGIAVVEAIGVLKWDPENLNVLSLGCIDTPTQVPTGKGYATMMRHLAQLFLMGQAHGSLGTAKLLLGAKERLTRIDHMASEGVFSLDSARKINDLKAIGRALAREKYLDINESFLTDKRTPFIPFHAHNTTSKE